FRLQRHVGRAEGDGARSDLLDAAAGADRLIVQAVAGLLLIGISPLRVDRIGEGRAGAGNVGSAGGSIEREGDDARRGKCGPVFHRNLSMLRSCGARAVMALAARYPPDGSGGRCCANTKDALQTAPRTFLVIALDQGCPKSRGSLR